MKLRTLFFFLIVLLPITAVAQFTQVSATVTDPNGVAYANGTVVAKLVLPGGTSPTLNGLPYTPPSQPVGLNTNGFFLMQLADNNVLLPAATTWSFTVCSAAGTVQPAGGKGPVCFNAGPLTITGASQSITATLNAAALALTLGGSGTVQANGTGISNIPAVYLAAGGSTTVSPVSSAGETFPSSAPIILSNVTTPNASGVLQIANDVSGSNNPGILSTGSGGNINLATYGNGGAGGNGTSTFQRSAAMFRICIGPTSVNSTNCNNWLGYIGTNDNCSSSSGACGAAPTGAVSIAAAATTVTVSTTAVQTNSNITITENSADGTRLGVTCNTTTGRTYSVTAITPGISFVITASAAPVTNPACVNFSFLN